MNQNSAGRETEKIMHDRVGVLRCLLWAPFFVVLRSDGSLTRKCDERGCLNGLQYLKSMRRHRFASICSLILFLIFTLEMILLHVWLVRVPLGWNQYWNRRHLQVEGV